MSLISLPSYGLPPVPLAHFPTRHQAFVFRASEFVSFEKMAEVLETTGDKVRGCAAEMGIYRACDSRIWLDRGYITVIRSMWHILPYEQLTKLLDTDAESLALLLREEDFLDVKLGKKPVCEPVRLRELTGGERARTARIREVMDALSFDGVRPFDFGYEAPPVTFSGRELAGLRMIYLFSGLYQKAFDVPSEEYCSDEMLDAYRRLGINAVWTQGVLYSLTEFPFDPSLSEGWEKRLDNLRRFTERLDRFGIKLILYINEPRSMPRGFFEKNPELRGAERSPDRVCLCTSVPEVREYLSGAVETVCRAAPLIGGFFTITRSENTTNCYSHITPENCTCPRCRRRTVGEVIGELLGALREGIDRVDPSKKLIAWSWDWDRFNLEIIHSLPKNVILESQSELYVPTEVGGVAGKVVDYSMGQPGPGERAREEWKLASSLGHETMAKIQVNTTWEGSTVPALPVFPLVEDHIKKIRDCGVKHFHLSWTLGGYPSGNLARAAKYWYEHAETPEESEAEKRASRLFSEALSEFPFCIGTLYYGPQNGGPSNLLFPEPTGYHATMTCFAFDDLEKWRSIYPAEIFESQFEKLCALWREGLDALNGEPETEFAIMANAAYCLYRSSLDQIRFLRAREAGDRETMRVIAANEEKTARNMLSLMNRNAAIGFEAANHYYFSKGALAEKVLNCRYLASALRGGPGPAGAKKERENQPTAG